MKTGQQKRRIRFPFLLRPSVAQTSPECPLCAQGEAHRVFITAPPGWGSVMKCSAATRPHGVIVRSQEEATHLRAERMPQ